MCLLGIKFSRQNFIQEVADENAGYFKRQNTTQSDGLYLSKFTDDDKRENNSKLNGLFKMTASITIKLRDGDTKRSYSSLGQDRLRTTSVDGVQPTVAGFAQHREDEFQSHARPLIQ